MSYAWIKVFHVVAGAGFIAVHGASMLVLHLIRPERSRDTIRAILDFAARTTSSLYISLLAVIGTGFWLAFERSSFFRRGWFWWSLAILLATTAWMWFVARPFADRIRAACEIRPSGVPRVSSAELAQTLGSRRSDLIAVVGVVSIVLILVLMVVQPRVFPVEPVAGGPTTLATAPTTVGGNPPPTGVTSTTVMPNTTTTDQADQVLALGREIFESRGGIGGCSECHGSDGLGTADGPGIVGYSKSEIAKALEDVPDMEYFRLTPEELEAVYRYIQSLPP